MILVIGVFLVATGIAMGIGWAVSSIPGNMAQRRLAKRLKEVGSMAPVVEGEAATVVRQEDAGPLPAVQRLLGKTAGSSLERLIEQSGVRATTGGIISVSIGLAMLGVLGVLMFAPVATAAPLGLVAGVLPFLFLLQRRSARIKKLVYEPLVTR